MGINIVLFNTFCRSRGHPWIQWWWAGSQEQGELTHASKLNCSHVDCCTEPPNGHGDGQKYKMVGKNYISMQLHSPRNFAFTEALAHYLLPPFIVFITKFTWANVKDLWTNKVSRGNRNILQPNTAFLRGNAKVLQVNTKFFRGTQNLQTNAKFLCETKKLWEWMQRFSGMQKFCEQTQKILWGM